MIHSPSDIKQLGTTLVIGAHPDDETFMAAGLMASAVRSGQRVVCVTATRGEAGSQDHEKWPPETLGEIRTKELNTALGIIGVSEHHWLDYPDGGCDQIDDKAAAQKIYQLVGKVHIDSILTFGPEGMTGHPDHQAVSRWATLVAKQLSVGKIYHAINTEDQYENHLKQADDKLNIFFNIDKPPITKSGACDIHFTLSPELQQLKHKALAAMTSQTETMLRLLGKKFLHDGLSIEAFVLAK